MNTPSTQFVTSGRMGIYDPIHQMGLWGETFKGNGNINNSVPMIIGGNPNTSSSIIMPADTKLDNQSEDTSQGTFAPCNKYDQEATKPVDKIQRRLAQNREAARKSRLRKKAYVQQLESSRLKLAQLEQELERARQQAWRRGLYLGGGIDSGQLSFSEHIKPGIADFEMKYEKWKMEQNGQISLLRTALGTHISDRDLSILVENGLKQYSDLFRMKEAAAKTDVFYMMSGLWKSSAERFFLWIGGFRPSELLKVLLPQIEPLIDQQRNDVSNLEQSCRQAEDALSQGMEKLQQKLSETIAAGHFGETSYPPQMDSAMEKLEDLVRFVLQADHLRRETLQQMARILTPRQAARGLLALGEYFQRFRALSSLWADHHREPA